SPARAWSVDQVIEHGFEPRVRGFEALDTGALGESDLGQMIEEGFDVACFQRQRTAIRRYLDRRDLFEAEQRARQAACFARAHLDLAWMAREQRAHLVHLALREQAP